MGAGELANLHRSRDEAHERLAQARDKISRLTIVRASVLALLDTPGIEASEAGRHLRTAELHLGHDIAAAEVVEQRDLRVFAVCQNQLQDEEEKFSA